MFKPNITAEELRRMSERDATIAIVKGLIHFKRLNELRKRKEKQLQASRIYQTINSCSF